jgi:hypothetical protein
MKFRYSELSESYSVYKPTIFRILNFGTLIIVICAYQPHGRHVTGCHNSQALLLRLFLLSLTSIAFINRTAAI